MFDKTSIQGHYEDTEWYSDQIIEGTSTEWRSCFSMGWLKLSYISEDQLNTLKTHFSSITELSGTNNIKYLGEPVEPGEEGCSGGASNIPIYWKFSDAEPVLTLCYLSEDMIAYLIQTDLHNADLANNSYYGPSQIPCFSIGKTI